MNANSFSPNFAKGRYHHDKDINEAIRKAKANEIELKDMIEYLETRLGKRDVWDTYEVVSRFRHQKGTFDTMIHEYMALRITIAPRSDLNTDKDDKMYASMIEQSKAYDTNHPESISDTMKRQVKRYVSNDIFKNVRPAPYYYT